MFEFGYERSSSESQSRSFISEEQMPFLKDLWRQASGIAGRAGDASGTIAPWLAQGAQGLLGMGDPTAQIQAQTASLQSGLGQLFREEINPAIQSNAISTGGFGGGRQGVAQGVAAGQMANAFTQGVGDITARANQTAMGALGMLPGFSQAYTQAQSAGMNPFLQLAQILGRPVTLQEQSSTSESEGFNFGFSTPGG